MFQSSASGSSVTSRCSQRSSIRFGQKVVVVDTPGIFDTVNTNEHNQTEICKCIAFTSPGPHAFILVLSVSRFTEEDYTSIEHFVKHFGENIFNYLIILFTRKDDLDEDGKTLSDHIQSSPPQLQMLIEKCGGRVIAFDNRLSREEQDVQTRTLLDIIMENVAKNKGNCYTNEMYKESEQNIKRKEEEIKSKIRENQLKEIHSMEGKIVRKYEIRIAEHALKCKNAQIQLDELNLKKKADERRILQVMEKLRKCQKQLKDSHAKGNESLDKSLDELQCELKKVNEDVGDLALKIKKLNISKTKAERQQLEIIQRQNEETMELKKEIKALYDEKIKTIRDGIRKDIQENGRFFKIALPLLITLLKTFW